MRYRRRSVGSAHIVWMVGPGTAVGRCRWAPAEAVDVVVVGVHPVEMWVVEVAHKGVVRRHSPVEVGSGYSAAETQILGGAVHAVAICVVKPDAGEVDGHIYFFASIGVITV